MPSAEQLKALFRSHVDGDETHFLSIALQVAAYEARKGHTKLADELRSIVEEAKNRQRISKAQRAPTLIAQPRGELSSLVSVSYPSQTLSAMIASEMVTQRLARMIDEQRHFVRIREHGLSPRRKLLLMGPPGTGKTLTASVLAGELHLPLFQVRLDGLISKFLGETASKLRLIFDAVSGTRGVYFFDEFDAIASQRGLPNDVGEIRRVLNTFLQLIEQDESTGLILAATNHPEILDYAVFRRFDDVIEYELPGANQIEDTIRARLTAFGFRDVDWAELARGASGLSYAEITRAVDEAVKEAIIRDRDLVSGDDLSRALSERLTMRPAHIARKPA